MAEKVKLKVEFDGKPIASINHLSINQPINGHHSFELRCSTKLHASLLTDTLESYIGKKVKIEIGSPEKVKYGDDTKNYFNGIVTNIRLSKHQGAFDEIVYEGYGPSILMDDGPHAQSFLDQSLKDIISVVSGKYEVDIQIDPKYAAKIPYFVQYNESSFHYIARLAAIYAEWFYFDGTKMYFGKPHQEESELELVFQKDLTSFDLGLSIVPSKFKLLGYEYLGHQHPDSASTSAKVGGLDDFGKTLARTSDEVFKNEPTVITRHDIASKSDLDTFTLHRKATHASNYVVFNGSSNNHRIKLGSIVKISGKFGDSLGIINPIDYGEYRIIHISQSIDGTGNYHNHFKAVPSSLEMPPVNYQVTEPFCEIQAAEVLDNHDKDELGRVKVQSWWQKPTGDETPWIRVAASGAGAGHGAFFVPEKGDQVLIGFEHNNPNKPYVIGSLFHGKAKPEGVADPNNNKKALKTKSGNQIFLGDEGGSEEIKIENGSNVIHLSLSGSGSISITTDGDLSLSGNNITITAKESFKVTTKDGEINASNDLKHIATNNQNIDGNTVSIQAKTTASVKGTDVSITGDKSATVNGTATAEISGAKTTVNGKGMVEVVGGIIKLN